MIIDFTFTEMAHPGSEELSVLGLAKILESKYNICENFTNYIREKLLKRMDDQINKFGYIQNAAIQSWLQNEWREYIISGKAGYTAASAGRGDPAFVDSSTYYLSMQPIFIYDKNEEKFIV